MQSLRPWIAALVVATSADALEGCQKKAVETPRQQARAVTVVDVAARQIEGGLVASGTLVPREDIAVFPQLTGYRVAKIFADVGDRVGAGQPLAQLDDTLLQAQIAQQTAVVQQLSTQADEAEAQAARVKGLDDQGLLSQEQIDTRRFAARSARAQAAAQAAGLRDLKTREGLMVIRAPRAGLVIERNVRLGDLPGGTTPWYRIAQSSQVELAADVDEDTLDKLRPGATAIVTLGDGTRVPGVVRLISPAIDPTTKLGKVRVTLPVRADVRAGGFAKASFTGVTRSALAVPETAVRYDADGASVMVVGSDDRVQRVPVTTGQRGGGWVELLRGPPVGSTVVDRAAAMLVPGDFIRPAQVGAASAAPPPDPAGPAK